MRSLRPCSDSSATPSFPSQPEGPGRPGTPSRPRRGIASRVAIRRGEGVPRPGHGPTHPLKPATGHPMELSCMHLPSGASTRGTGTRGHPRDQQALEEWSQCRLISTSPPFQVSFSPPTLHFSAAFFPEPIKWLHLFREGQRCIPRRSGLFWTGFKTGKRQCRTGAGDHQPRLPGDAGD